MISSISSSSVSASAQTGIDATPPADAAQQDDATLSATVASVTLTISSEGNDRLSAEEQSGDAATADASASTDAPAAGDAAPAAASKGPDAAPASGESGGTAAAKASSAATTEKIYEAADANQDGKVTTQEQQAYDAAQAAARKAADAAPTAQGGAAAAKTYEDVKALVGSR